MKYVKTILVSMLTSILVYQACWFSLAAEEQYKVKGVALAAMLLFTATVLDCYTIIKLSGESSTAPLILTNIATTIIAYLPCWFISSQLDKGLHTIVRRTQDLDYAGGSWAEGLIIMVVFFGCLYFILTQRVVVIIFSNVFKTRSKQEDEVLS